MPFTLVILDNATPITFAMLEGPTPFTLLPYPDGVYVMSKYIGDDEF